MSYWAGLAGGFGSAREADLKQQSDQEQQNRQNETAIFTHLLGSSDPQIQTAALLGLVDSANPKRKNGIAGWFGQMQANPNFEKIKQLISTPETVSQTVQGPQATTGIPSAVQLPGATSITPQVTGGPPATPSGAPSAAQAPTALTQGGPPPALGWKPSAPQPINTSATFTSQRPRQVFRPQEEQDLLNAKSKSAGEVEGLVSGLVTSGVPEAQARETVRQEMLRRAAGSTATYQSVPGQRPDGTPAFADYDRTLGTYVDPVTKQAIPGFQPKAANVTLGVDREAGARQLFGKAAKDLTQNEMATVDQWAIQRAQTISNARGVGTGQAQIQTDLNKPIGPTAAALYGVPANATIAQLGDRVPLIEADKQKVAALSDADHSIAEIEDLIPKVFPNVAPGLIGNIHTQISLGMQALSASKDLRSLDAAMDFAVVNISKMAGESGRVPVQVIENIKRSMANTSPSMFHGDELQSAQAKLAVIKDGLAQVKAAMDAQTGGLPTQPPPGGTPPKSAAPPSINPGAVPKPIPTDIQKGQLTPPDLTGLTPGKNRRFVAGPFKGQVWTIDANGTARQVQ